MHLNWEALLREYGYVAVLIGTFLEGESILVMGGFAAHQGYLQLPLVVLSAFVGSFTGDQLFFYIGRRVGAKLLARHPKWQARVMRVHALMERFHTAFILGFRFLYGLRTISPFALGTSDVTRQRFFILNLIGAAVWAVTVGSAGYAFGSVLEMFLGRMKQYERPIFIGLIVLLALVGLLFHLRGARKDAEVIEANRQLPPSTTQAPDQLP